MAETVKVEAMDPEKRNSPVSGPVHDEATVMLDSASRVCYWNGAEFADGQMVECDGVRYECSFGQWVKHE